jgi:hypothetical protein
MFRAQLCIALTVASVFFFGWQSIDESIHNRRAFAEIENNLHPDDQDVFFNVEGMLGDTLRVSTMLWNPDEVHAGTVITEALFRDQAIHQTLLDEGFRWVSNGSHVYKIPPMLRIRKKIEPRKPNSSGKNPFPVA